MSLPLLFNRLFKQGQGGQSSDSARDNQESLTNDRIGILSSRTSKSKLFAHLINDTYYSFLTNTLTQGQGEQSSDSARDNRESLIFDRIGILSSRTSKSKLFAHLINETFYSFLTNTLTQGPGNKVTSRLRD